MFTGTIVEESLRDNRFLNSLKIVSVRISSDDDPAARWHLYKVELSMEQIESLAQELKPEKWYAHFWLGDDVIAVFPKKTFRFKHSQPETWQAAVTYGQSLGIPTEQLDFVIE